MNEVYLGRRWPKTSATSRWIPALVLSIALLCGACTSHSNTPTNPSPAQTTSIDTSGDQLSDSPGSNAVAPWDISLPASVRPYDFGTPSNSAHLAADVKWISQKFTG